tara:strand:+ start:4341 stop:5090 length:750 start_codon:yes stop_codon:yes gene_type:complete
MQVTAQDFEDVYATAQMAHVGQKRRSGEPYFSHPSAVRNLVRKYYPGDNGSQMVALLHDSIEDAPGSTVSSVEEMKDWIRGSISDRSTAEEVISTVEKLSHEKGQDYASYVVSLLGDTTALRVKLADMLHNLSSSPSPRQKQKYADALRSLSDSAGGIPSGIDASHWDKLSALTEGKGTRMLRLFIRESIRDMSRKIEKGTAVRCRETGRVGIVLEKRRGASTTYARVLWSSGVSKVTLTEVVDLEVVE